MLEGGKRAVEGVVDEARTEFSARLRNPFVGVFIFSWLAWNHRLIFVLFSDMRVGKKFDFIDYDLYTDAWQVLSWNVLWPLVSTIFYILFVPWLTELVHAWNLWHQRRLKARDLRSENHTLLTLEQSIDLKKMVARKNSDINELASKLAGANKKLKRVSAVNAALRGAGSSSADAAIKEFLCSDVFAVRLVVDLSADVSVHSFENDGTVHSTRINRDRAVTADGWLLSEGKLVLRSDQGQELATFIFNPNEAQFEGSAGSRRAFLVARSM